MRESLSVSITCTSFTSPRISSKFFENKYTTIKLKKKLYSFSKTIIYYTMSKIHLCRWTLIFTLHKHEFIIFKKILAEQFERYYWQDCLEGEGSASPANLTSKCFFVKGEGEEGKFAEFGDIGAPAMSLE